jgi:hypothetical protein
LLGKFYNDEHIARYWFTSSNNISFNHTPGVFIDSAFLSSPSPSSLVETDYLMVKNDSVNINRNAIYVPFDETQFLSESGSAYDSNFMALKANVQYIIDISATILKDASQTNANITFYFTSSTPEAKRESTYTDRFGVKIATLTANQSGLSSINIDHQTTFFIPSNDLYGTMVIVPKYCQAYIKNISFRIYGDDGFSPDSFTTRVPWPVTSPNETFQVKAELLDINHNIVYSNLNILASFDASGSSLSARAPDGSTTGGGGSGGGSIPGDLHVGGLIYNPNIVARSAPISQSRMLSVRSDGAIVFDPIVDMSLDDKYIYLSLGDASNRLLTTITTKKSLASEYDGTTAGRKIYWVSGVKHVETSP